MSKEMFITSSPHETKVAVCEDDQLVEIYIERDTDVGLVGGIYKGRVNRVLPGMQSAFVDIGLERDAFLYVSDFSLPGEEFEGVFDEVEGRVPSGVDSGMTSGLTTAQVITTQSPPENDAGQSPEAAASLPATGSSPAARAGQPQEETSAALSAATVVSTPPSGAPASPREHGFQKHERGRRRRRRGRGGFGERKPGQRPETQHAETQRTETQHRPVVEPSSGSARTFEILPGESLAKYSRLRSESGSTEATSANHTTEIEASGGVTSPESVETQSEVFTPNHLAEENKPAPSSFSDAAVEQSSQGAKPVQENFAEAADNLDETDVLPSEWAEQPQFSESASPGESRLEAPVSELNSSELAETPAATPEEVPAGGAPAAPGSETGERQFTLRDQHTRPRFAPRRRRGRRGMRRDQQPEGTRDSSRSSNNQPLKISELLKEGQEILVQIAKEPLGTKGARITSHVALPGRYVVYMPTISHIGVSRRITSEQERLRLRNIILEHRGSLTGGFIVRTAGEGHSQEEIKADLRFLTTLWNDIRTKAEQSKAPALIYRDLDLVQRLLRDILTPDFKSVRVDNEMEYARVVEFISRTQPALLPNAKLHTRETSLFEESGVSAEIEKALKPKVWLKSGGYIVINQTEALVAIDVNTGKYVGKTNRLEDTILKTNIDAVKEIVRQLRLRDLGGIIVVDFIDMDERRNRNRVVQAMEEALRNDRAPTKVLSFNEFGLVALTRKRVKQSLQRSLCEPCAYCSGSGWVKSVTTVCSEILSEARKMAEQSDNKTLTLRVHPEVARTLKSREGFLISEIESATHKDFIIKSDPNIQQERFEIF